MNSLKQKQFLKIITDHLQRQDITSIQEEKEKVGLYKTWVTVCTKFEKVITATVKTWHSRNKKNNPEERTLPQTKKTVFTHKYKGKSYQIDIYYIYIEMFYSRE